jgi:hypothetical protein
VARGPPDWPRWIKPLDLFLFQNWHDVISSLSLSLSASILLVHKNVTV